MEIRIKGNEIRFVYSDDLVGLMDHGKCTITRASTVEPTSDNRWEANLALSGGPVLGPYASRKEALEAEVSWLYQNRIPIPENMNV